MICFVIFFFFPSPFQALEIWTYRHWASVSTFERWPSVTSSCHTFFCWESQPWCNCSSKGRYFIVATVLSSRIFTHLKPLKSSQDTLNKGLEVYWFGIYHCWFRDNNNSSSQYIRTCSGTVHFNTGVTAGNKFIDSWEIRTLKN